MSVARACTLQWNQIHSFKSLSIFLESAERDKLHLMQQQNFYCAQDKKSRRIADKIQEGQTQREWSEQQMERNYTHLLDITPTIHKNDKVVKTDQTDSCISNSGMPVLHQWNQIDNFNSLSICPKCPERD